MGRVVSIVYCPRDTQDRRPMGHYARVPLENARLVEGQGVEGDLKGRSDSRQLNVMCAEVLEELRGEGFKVGPGEMGEQIVVEGIDPETLLKGTRLQLGRAVIEVGIPRTGCSRFEMIQGRPKQSVAGRLGVMARVVEGGEVAVGDEARLLPSEG